MNLAHTKRFINAINQSSSDRKTAWNTKQTKMRSPGLPWKAPPNLQDGLPLKYYYLAKTLNASVICKQRWLNVTQLQNVSKYFTGLK